MNAYVLIFTGLCFFAGQNSADSVPSSTPSTQPKADAESPSIEAVTRQPEYSTSDYGIVGNCKFLSEEFGLSPLPNDILYKEPYYETPETKKVPSLVFIESDDSLCGGNIIAKYWVLAPAHCVCHNDNGYKWNPAVHRVKAGGSSYVENTLTYEIDNVICHPRYGPPSVEDANWKYDNNIALIKLKENKEWGSDLKAIPINDPTSQSLAKNTTVIRVWGDECILGENSLRRTFREIMSREECEVIWKEHYSIPFRENILCLKKKSPCKGLYQSGASVQDVLVGIPSNNNTWCVRNDVFYTNVSYHINWMKNHVNNLELKKINLLA